MRAFLGSLRLSITFNDQNACLATKKRFERNGFETTLQTGAAEFEGIYLLWIYYNSHIPKEIVSDLVIDSLCA